ncbi:MAG: tetratricopeptide repeat protein [Phycisphaerales bacterium]
MTAKGAPNAEAAAVSAGMALLQRGQAAQAVPIFARLTAMPVDAHSAASVRRALGFALHACGRSADAIAPLREAEHVLKTDPSVPQALPHALRMVGRHEEAIQACRRCLKLDPGRAMVIALEIELLVRAGDEEARRRIGEADGAGIVDANIDVAVSVLALRSGGLEDAIARLQRRVGAGGRTREERVTLFFSLGHVLDAAGRYDEAWAAYTQGNEAIGQTFDVDRFHAGVEAIVRGWTPERIESLRAGGLADERPVLVVGMPRSGTTVVERALRRTRRCTRRGRSRRSRSRHLVGRATGATIDTRPSGSRRR